MDDLALHHRAVVIDTHADTTQAILYDGYDFLARNAINHLDLPRMREGGLDAQFFSIWVEPERFAEPQFHPEALRQLEAVEQLVARSKGAMALARTAADVRRNAQAGVISALLGAEGGHMLLPGSEEEQLEHLRAFAARGVRYLTLTWSNSNPIGGSSGDDGDKRGLTPFGARVLDELQRLGIVVDVSHVSDPLFWDTLRVVKKPVLASHSSARALSAAPRNVTDEMIVAIAKNGGAVCVNYWNRFLDEAFRAASTPISDAMKKEPHEKVVRAYREAMAAGKLPQVPWTRVVDHIDHIVKLTSADHACLGSDFDGIPLLPQGLEDVSKLPQLTAELRRRGYSVADIEKILGGNVLRVLEANEAPAAR